uniref:Uncharacterized protein n=1 Tax=Siphoviridae sp. ctE6L85 TaxID=2826202 RepID=A0A8S5QRC4_9CAUD|nr:MAG TPA: hypothetical protein [Siphoviridae sp. ctE6L85]
MCENKLGQVRKLLRSCPIFLRYLFVWSKCAFALR